MLSKLRNPLQGTRFRLPFSRLHGIMFNEGTEEVRDGSMRQNASTDAAEETNSKPSARERLNYLSGFRINFDAISFSSSAEHRGGGKAKVVQATARGEAGHEETVAVKKLNYHKGIKTEKFSKEFVHEVETLAGLSHENVIRLIGFAEELEHGKAWIVLSWHPNGNVSEFLATGDWEIPERISLIKDTLEGVKYLHSHEPAICHGDLKSLNILVSSSYRAIITDFGSARGVDLLENIVAAEDHDLESTGKSAAEPAKITVGASGSQLTLTGPSWSLRWAPPEVVNGATPGLESDIWSAGWVCWEIMTGKLPFPELSSAGIITMAVIQGNVPSALEHAQLSQITRLCSLMTDCWAFDPQVRPSISRCRNEVDCMPSTPPSGVNGPSVEVLLQMGRLHFLDCRYEKAVSSFRQALAAAKLADRFDANAEALDWLGQTYYLQTKYLEAEESFLQALEIHTRIDNDKGRANTLHGLGELYYSQSKVSEAEKRFIQAKELFTCIGNDKGRANTLRGLGNLYYTQTKFVEAEEFLIQANQIFTHIGNDPGRANTLQGLGDLYNTRGKYREAEDSLIQARQIFTRIGDDQGWANTLEGLGSLYYAQARYSNAEESFSQALQIYTRIGNDRGRANTLGGLGGLYHSRGRYSEAEESLTQAEQIYTRIGDHEARADTLRCFGHLYSAQGRSLLAARCYAKARDLYSRIGLLAAKKDASYWLAAVSQK